MPPPEIAEIIAVGSELLTAHRIDTNSLFVTGRLNDLGIDVRAKQVIGDDRRDLTLRIREALARVDVLVTTGGLGPTDDDLTREVVAAVLERPLVLDDAILSRIVDRFASRGVPMPEINRRQAMVPVGAEVLPNPRGTAPGLWITHAAGIVVLLPGPPRELQPMFDDFVAPRLAALTTGKRIRRRVVKVHGRSESQVEEIAFPIYSRLGDAVVPVQTTILATPGQIELHLAAATQDLPGADARLQQGVDELAAALGASVFSVDGRSLEQVVGDLLREQAKRIAVAESCTGGLVLARLTDVPGSSAWVMGGVVAYDNQVKVQQIDVPASLIEEHGAVSEPVALAMARGVRMRLGADVGVGVTGIAGPSGGTDAKPVGTVVIAVDAGEPAVRTFRFPGDRAQVRSHASAAALDFVRRTLQSDVPARRD